MQKPDGSFDFSLDTTLDEELEKERERQVRKTQVEAGDDPLSFLLGSVPEEPKKPKRILEFESIFDVSKLIEDKTLKKEAASPAQTRASLFLTGGGEEDFLSLIEQSTKKPNNRRGYNSRPQEEEEEVETPYEEPPKPTPLEMREEFEAFVYKPAGGELAANGTQSVSAGGDASRSEADAQQGEGHANTENDASNTEEKKKQEPAVDTEVKEENEKQEKNDESKSQVSVERELDVPHLTQKALDRELVHTKIRGLCWKVFLGLLGSKPAEWKEQLEEQRAAYDVLHKRYMVDPHAEGRELDPAINNPLSQAEESPWQQYFQDAELKKQIVLDIRRVYPENGFFKDKDLQEMMLRILFIYAREHEHILYKQGMHELLAPILYVLHREAVNAEDEKQLSNAETTASSSAGEIVSMVNSSRFIEHDAYTLFDKVMEHTNSWFLSGTRGPASIDLEAEPFADPYADNSVSSPVVQKCKRIQQELLRRADPQLFQYLTDLSIEPQLYALRWVRLLLGREFHLEDVLRLWDAIFAYGQGLTLVDYIIVAMLMYIRESLLGKEYTACLQRLFKYPPVEDVSGFITKALALINPKAASAKASNTASATSSPIIPASLLDSPLFPAGSESEVATTDPLGAHKQAKPAKATKAAKTDKKKKSDDKPFSPSSHRHSLADTLKHLIPESKPHVSKSPAKKPESPAVTALHSQVAELTARVAELDRTQTHMATRLERIIFSLHNGFVDKKNVLSEDERMDSVLLALAEMKQIKDILTGLLPLEAPEAFDSFDSPISSTPTDSAPMPLAPPVFAVADDADADAEPLPTTGEMAHE